MSEGSALRRRTGTYVVIYLGTHLPVIGVGALATSIGFNAAVQVFAYVVAAVCLGGLAPLGWERRALDRPA